MNSPPPAYTRTQLYTPYPPLPSYLPVHYYTNLVCTYHVFCGMLVTAEVVSEEIGTVFVVEDRGNGQ